MRCTTCGRESPNEYKFCQFCGSILAAPIDLRDSRLEPARQMIARSVYYRTSTDKHLSYFWLVAIIVIPLISVLVGLIAVFSTIDFSDPNADLEPFPLAVSLFIDLTSLVSAVLYGFLIYYLVKRQNDHYTREDAFRNGVSTLIRTAAWSPDRMNDIVPETMALSTVERRQEPQRKIWFWIFVYFLPFVAVTLMSAGMTALISSTDTISGPVIGAIVGTILILLVSAVLEFYLFYFLTQTMLDHDRRWNTFAYNARRAMSKLGFPSGRPYRVSRLPERSMVLYIILSILTGIFLYYWIYVILKDPNEHFQYQWEFEDNVMSSIVPQEYASTSSVSRP